MDINEWLRRHDSPLARHRSPDSSIILRRDLKSEKQHAGPPSGNFQRRTRRKPKPDLYEPLAGEKRKHNRKIKADDSKRHKRSHRTNRLTRQSVSGLLDDFHAKSVEQSRLTLRQPLNAGIFNRSKASIPQKWRGQGLPDLVFSEMRFLSKPGSGVEGSRRGDPATTAVESVATETSTSAHSRRRKLSQKSYGRGLASHRQPHCRDSNHAAEYPTDRDINRDRDSRHESLIKITDAQSAIEMDNQARTPGVSDNIVNEQGVQPIVGKVQKGALGEGLCRTVSAAHPINFGHTRSDTEITSTQLGPLIEPATALIGTKTAQCMDDRNSQNRPVSSSSLSLMLLCCQDAINSSCELRIILNEGEKDSREQKTSEYLRPECHLRDGSGNRPKQAYTNGNIKYTDQNPITENTTGTWFPVPMPCEQRHQSENGENENVSVYAGNSNREVPLLADRSREYEALRGELCGPRWDIGNPWRESCFEMHDLYRLHDPEQKLVPRARAGGSVVKNEQEGDVEEQEEAAEAAENFFEISEHWDVPHTLECSGRYYEAFEEKDEPLPQWFWSSNRLY